MAFDAIGFPVRPTVVLVGFKVAGDHEFDVCIEPENGPYSPDDFVAVEARAAELYGQHPDRHMIHSVAEVHEAKHRAMRDETRAQAVVEIFEKHSANHGEAYFCSPSNRVGDYAVHIVLGVPEDVIATVPRLATTERDRFRIAPSLVHALIDDILYRAATTLYLPNPGSGLRALGAETPEIVRTATESFVRSIFLCASDWFGSSADLTLTSISALPYEGRAGVGSLVLAKEDDPDVEVALRIKRPVKLSRTRAVRKLMEASDPKTALLIAEQKVYGLGRVKTSYDPARESVFEVSVLGRGAWDLSHDGRPLLSVRDGVSHLPLHILDTRLLTDAIERILPSPDVPALLDLAQAAGKHQHGAMLVISSNAAGEAERLSPQSWDVEPVSMVPDLLTQLTAMDGAVLLDPQANCHAIGVILDGRAAGKGDPARGSRFNNAVRYLDTGPPPAVVVVYSADGTIDILPNLQPRVKRSTVQNAVQRYLELAAIRPPDFELVSDAWDTVKAVKFYLSKEQCAALNEAREAIEQWRMEHNHMRLDEPDLRPSPEMNDSYWLD